MDPKPTVLIGSVLGIQQALALRQFRMMYRKGLDILKGVGTD
jgi:hypothetical protein